MNNLIEADALELWLLTEELLALTKLSTTPDKHASIFDHEERSYWQGRVELLQQLLQKVSSGVAPKVWGHEREGTSCKS